MRRIGAYPFSIFIGGDRKQSIILVVLFPNSLRQSLLIHPVDGITFEDLKGLRGNQKREAEDQQDAVVEELVFHRTKYKDVILSRSGNDY